MFGRWLRSGAGFTAVVAALVAVACCTTARGEVAAVPATPDPRDFTLRVADLDPGYVIGDDGSCHIDFDIWPTGDRDPIYLINECSVAFRRIWMPHGRVFPEPQSVESYAWVLPTPGDAAAQFRAATKDAHRPGSPQPIADEARLTRRVVRDRVLVVDRNTGKVGYRLGRANATTEIRWRSGRFLARIVLDGDARRVTRSAILRLARKQQARIATPTALTDTDVDDRLVALDDPRFGVPVWWLGSRFEPGGALPAIELQSAAGGGGDFDTGPGWTGELQYGSDPFESEVTVGIWKPQIWRRSVRRRFGRLVWDSRCTISRSFAVEGGRATVYAGYRVRSNTCDGRERDSFMAIVRRKHTILTVNMPLCYTCGTGGGPYASFAGVETVARALRPRPRGR